MPPSPKMDNLMEDEDMICMDEVEEVIELDNSGDMDDEDGAGEDPLVQEDAICVFRGHKKGGVFCGSLTKNGELAATGGEEDKAYIWDTSTGEIILDCSRQSDSIIFSEFSQNQKYIAVGDMSGSIQVWEVAEKNHFWCNDIGDVTWMKWHPVSSILLAGTVVGDIYMFKIPTEYEKFFLGYGCRAETGTVFPDGKRLAVGYEDGVIRIIDLKTSEEISISSPLGHSATITTLDCHSDNNLLISSDVSGKTILSTAKTSKIICVLQDLNNGKRNSIANTDEDAESSKGNSDSNWVETAAFCKNPTFQVAATGTVNGEIFIWDILKQVLRLKIEQESGISKLLWKGNTHVLFSAGLDGILRCFDARNGQCLRSFKGHTADILDLYISENGEKALTTSDDSTARIFDISSIS
ncbi:angio-associated migratory cell protein [Hylaeus volcanicus]|uniref:angio-associated migratory cell protein n=1 Tax=Hylaeus volcanicus TaxID=313075 RepID=UPI0023B827AB|nr:angio-associated migratory cell protein [Hylaeus volcanicus]XP_053981417.1 angio-associated migratory cell protein [Hylaeus volcanicus]